MKVHLSQFYFNYHTEKKSKRIMAFTQKVTAKNLTSKMISRVDQYFNIVGSNYMVMAMALEALFL